LCRDRCAGRSRSGYTGFDKALVFDQTFLEKFAIKPFEKRFSLKPFLKRLAVKDVLKRLAIEPLQKGLGPNIC
jgi:hypothetical protein